MVPNSKCVIFIPLHVLLSSHNCLFQMKRLYHLPHMEILITGSGDNMPLCYKRHCTSEVKMGGWLRRISIWLEQATRYTLMLVEMNILHAVMIHMLILHWNLHTASVKKECKWYEECMYNVCRKLLTITWTVMVVELLRSDHGMYIRYFDHKNESHT